MTTSRTRELTESDLENWVDNDKAELPPLIRAEDWFDDADKVEDADKVDDTKDGRPLRLFRVGEAELMALRSMTESERDEWLEEKLRACEKADAAMPATPAETPRRGPPSHRWLVSYWEHPVLEPGDVFGYYRENDCGCPSVWVLTDSRREPGEVEDGTYCHWVVPYAGTRYAYAFDTYGRAEGCKRTGQVFLEKMAELAVPRPGDTLTHSHFDGHCRVVLQTDDLLEGWDSETGMLNRLEADALGGELALIDFAKVADEDDTPMDRKERLGARIEQLRAEELDRDYSGFGIFEEK